MELNKTRAICEDFCKDFEDGGCLNELLKAVLHDDTLCLEFRGEYRAVIYYRGGALYTIQKVADNENSSKSRWISFNNNYCDESSEEDVVEEEEPKDYKLSIEDAVRDIQKYKGIMDRYFSKHKKYEREFQQLILRENNYVGDISNASDYFILDIEYSYHKKKNDMRFDMLAVEWPSRKRTNRKNLPLIFVEVKYGDDALKGTSGIEKHINDYISFRNNESAMEKVFKQKLRLGLISSYQDEKKERIVSEITIDSKNPKYIFVFANHKRKSTKLKNEIEKAIDNHKNDEPDRLDEIRVAKASEMGYGLFSYGIKGYCYPSIKEFAKEL